MDQPTALAWKKAVFEACELQVREAALTAKKALQEAREAAASETKSSVGDKHETGRAMAQLEQEKHARMLGECMQKLELMDRINPNKLQQKLEFGALAETSKGWYFLAVGQGSIQVEGREVFVLSPASPVGKVLLGSQAEDVLTFRGEELVVHFVC